MLDFEITVKGRRAYTYEQLSEMSGRTVSALRSLAHRGPIAPAVHITKSVPAFYAEDFHIEVEQSKR